MSANSLPNPLLNATRAAFAELTTPEAHLWYREQAKATAAVARGIAHQSIAIVSQWLKPKPQLLSAGKALTVEPLVPVILTEVPASVAPESIAPQPAIETLVIASEELPEDPEDDDELPDENVEEFPEEKDETEELDDDNEGFDLLRFPKSDPSVFQDLKFGETIMQNVSKRLVGRITMTDYQDSTPVEEKTAEDS